MKRVYVNEKWCLGCRLCEYYCAFSATGKKDIVKALKDYKINPNIKIEDNGFTTFAVSCRHCEDPLCVKSCISGAIKKENGVVKVDREKCVGCCTCILVCPYGALTLSDGGTISKCELCTQNGGEPYCVKGCPNKAIVYEER
jgi:carbon-monoxide dehydrogenase iron sulfur subunit